MKPELKLPLRSEILEAFTPGTPIDETELFAGRPETIQKLQDIVFDPGRHAVLFGERGVGKTSLANIFHLPLNRPKRPVLAVRVFADETDNFDSLWRKVFKRLQKSTQNGAVVSADKLFPEAITADDVVTELGDFSINAAPIVILDEFDRLKDQTCKALVTDVIKGLSDSNINCTIVVVGVAKSVMDLIAGHASITRAMPQILMRRMTNDELSSIVRVRTKRLGMTIDEQAVWRISFFSAGLPFYTHSLGRHATLLAVSEGQLNITETDIFNSLPDFYGDVDHSIKESYVRATEKIYRKKNIFSHVLAACALADMDSLGRFSAADVEEPLSAILGREMKSMTFAFALNEMTNSERGSVLIKSGERRVYRYQFVDARMQPYVVMHSLNSNLITKELVEKFTIQRQRSFWSPTEHQLP